MIVDARNAHVRLRHERPRRLAQCTCDLHRVERALDFVGRGRFEVGIEKPPIVGCGEASVGGEIREIEHRRAESAILPVDQPETRAVVDEVAGQEVVMAEDDRERHLRRLQRVGERRPPLNVHTRLTWTRLQRAQIAADHMEGPK
jgi:hypothetical protein